MSLATTGRNIADLDYRDVLEKVLRRDFCNTGMPFTWDALREAFARELSKWRFDPLALTVRRTVRGPRVRMDALKNVRDKWVNPGAMAADVVSRIESGYLTRTQESTRLPHAAIVHGEAHYYRFAGEEEALESEEIVHRPTDPLGPWWFGQDTVDRVLRLSEGRRAALSISPGTQQHHELLRSAFRSRLALKLEWNNLHPAWTFGLSNGQELVSIVGIVKGQNLSEKAETHGSAFFQKYPEARGRVDPENKIALIGGEVQFFFPITKALPVFSFDFMKEAQKIAA